MKGAWVLASAFVLGVMCAPALAEDVPPATAAAQAPKVLNPGAASPATNLDPAEAEEAAEAAAAKEVEAKIKEEAEKEAAAKAAADVAAGTQSGAAPAPAAAAAPEPPPEPTLAIDINLTSQRLTVTEDGVTKYTWPVSSGRFGYPTPTGNFKPTWMSKMWYSRQYEYAAMPHSIFFKGGAAIHATNQTGQLGMPASHGCVRLAPRNAATLYGLVSRHGKARTTIAVHGKPKYPAPQIARNQYGSRYAHARRGAYGYGYNSPFAFFEDDAPVYYAPRRRRAYAYEPPRRYAYPPPRYVQRRAGRYRYDYGY